MDYLVKHIFVLYWINEWYKIFLNTNIKFPTIDTWLYIDEIDNEFYWILGEK